MPSRAGWPAQADADGGTAAQRAAAGSLTSTLVPRPGGLVSFSVPPSASARSRRPVSPEPSGSAPPAPSSRTDRLSTPRPASTETVTVSAFACLATFASASETALPHCG